MYTHLGVFILQNTGFYQKEGTVAGKKKLRPFVVDFKATLDNGIHVRMSKEVFAATAEEAPKVCRQAVAKEYGRTAYCIPFEALSVDEA